MRLSELMSQMNLATYPQVALILFLAIFVVVTVRTFSKHRRATYEELAHMPLRSDEPAASPEHEGAE